MSTEAITPTEPFSVDDSYHSLFQRYLQHSRRALVIQRILFASSLLLAAGGVWLVFAIITRSSSTLVQKRALALEVSKKAEPASHRLDQISNRLLQLSTDVDGIDSMEKLRDQRKTLTDEIASLELETKKLSDEVYEISYVLRRDIVEDEYQKPDKQVAAPPIVDDNAIVSIMDGVDEDPKRKTVFDGVPQRNVILLYHGKDGEGPLMMDLQIWLEARDAFVGRSARHSGLHRNTIHFYNPLDERLATNVAAAVTKFVQSKHLRFITPLDLKLLDRHSSTSRQIEVYLGNIGK